MRETTAADAAWVDEFVREHWAGPAIVTRGRVYRPAELPGLIAEAGGIPVGLLTYRLGGDACEIMTFDAIQPHRGVGTALLDDLVVRLRAREITRIWLITTNDNLAALRFYQRRGFVLVAVHASVIDEVSRPLKPSIPRIGSDGIPIRDEIELERRL